MGRRKSNKKKPAGKESIQQKTDVTDKRFPIVMNSTPLFLSNVALVGSMLKYMVIPVLVIIVCVIGWLALYVLFGDGWKALYDFVVDFVTFWELEFVIQLFVMFLPFLVWGLFSAWFMKYYKTDYFIVRSEGITMEKRNGRLYVISYPMLKEYISSNKIRIGPDWIQIPCWDLKFRLYSDDKKQVKELIQVLGEKCDFSVPEDELLETLNEYMIGWNVSYRMGIPCVVLGCYITMLSCILEESASMKMFVPTLFSTDNFFGCAGIVILLIGWLLKLVYYSSMRSYFKPYDDYFYVSFF